MKRQAVQTTPRELIELALEFLSEEYVTAHQKIQVNIINKEGVSDSWEFEK